jgi:hypothetical protein
MLASNALIKHSRGNIGVGFSTTRFRGRLEISTLRRVIPVSILLTMSLVLAVTPLVRAGTDFNSDINSQNPIWYVYAQVWGYYYDYPPYDYYDSDHDGWAYAWGWPVCWKYAADYIQGWQTTTYCRTKVTGYLCTILGPFQVYVETEVPE